MALNLVSLIMSNHGKIRCKIKLIPFSSLPFLIPNVLSAVAVRLHMNEVRVTLIIVLAESEYCIVELPSVEWPWCANGRSVNLHLGVWNDANVSYLLWVWRTNGALSVPWTCHATFVDHDMFYHWFLYVLLGNEICNVTFDDIHCSAGNRPNKST